MANLITLIPPPKESGQFDPCEFTCDECGANRWEMWIYDKPRRVVLECHAMTGDGKCGAAVQMEIE